MKGTKVLTLSAVAMYTPAFSRFHRLPTYACVVYIIIEYTYMRVHEKDTSGTDMQLHVAVCIPAVYQLLENSEHTG